MALAPPAADDRPEREADRPSASARGCEHSLRALWLAVAVVVHGEGE